MAVKERLPLSLLHLARQVRNAVGGRDLFVRPGHYYSPTSSDVDRRRQGEWDQEAHLAGIDIAEAEQLELASRLAGTVLPEDRWSGGPENRMFGRIDATVLHGMLTVNRPSRILEVGSGYSTAVMLDAADRDGTTTDITCVEPYPDRLNSLLHPGDTVTLVQSPVQDVPLDTFTDLGAGDLLFIDSTHVAKSGSDVLYLYLEVLPRLRPGVLVHAHDIFWPFSYPQEWLDEGRDWTEAYLLRALLSESPRWRIEFFSDWLWQVQPEVARRISSNGERPGSIYLRRT